MNLRASLVLSHRSQYLLFFFFLKMTNCVALFTHTSVSNDSVPNILCWHLGYEGKERS